MCQKEIGCIRYPSFREMEVLKLVAQGLRNKEIADKLYLSTDTIKKHLYNTFQKLQVSNRLELVNKAKDLGLIDGKLQVPLPTKSGLIHLRLPASIDTR